MGNGAIQTTSNKSSTQITESAPREESQAPALIQKKGDENPLWGALKVIASLRLTVVLFVLSFLLVFFNTMAQKNISNWQATTDYFRSFVVWVPFQQFIEFVQVFPGILKSVKLPGSFPFPGGWVLGGMLMLNLISAHIVRFRLGWKRSGILVLHAGIILLLVGELITGLFAVERNLTVSEGQSANYVYDLRNFELAIIDTSDPEFNEEVIVPGKDIRAGGKITNEQLPVDLEVLTFMENSRLDDVAQTYNDPIHKRKDFRWVGSGKDKQGNPVFFALSEQPRETGTDSNGTVDHPSAYITVKKKGTDEAIGTYLLSVFLSRPQLLMVDGKPYEIAIRFARDYKSYTFHLDEFERVNYPGTQRAHKFISNLTLIDPEHNEHRKVKISMNDPLRYEGETFYQASHQGDAQTTLQVVNNPGWLMPYISCSVITLGMLIHFGIMLVDFLRRRALKASAE